MVAKMSYVDDDDDYNTCVHNCDWMWSVDCITKFLVQDGEYFDNLWFFLVNTFDTPNAVFGVADTKETAAFVNGLSDDERRVFTSALATHGWTWYMKGNESGDEEEDYLLCLENVGVSKAKAMVSRRKYYTHDDTEGNEMLEVVRQV